MLFRYFVNKLNQKSPFQLGTKKIAVICGDEETKGKAGVGAAIMFSSLVGYKTYQGYSSTDEGTKKKALKEAVIISLCGLAGYASYKGLNRMLHGKPVTFNDPKSITEAKPTKKMH